MPILWSYMSSVDLKYQILETCIDMILVFNKRFDTSTSGKMTHFGSLCPRLGSGASPSSLGGSHFQQWPRGVPVGQFALHNITQGRLQMLSLHK